MVAKPLATPVTIPDAEPTVATEPLLVVHTPPVALLLKVVVPPAVTVAVPVLAESPVFTVAAVVFTPVAAQPLLSLASKV
jgi:hypothetical protein